MIFEAIFRHSAKRGMLHLDKESNLLVSQALPKYAYLAALGQLFVIDALAGTAIAPVTAPPVASPQWGLYNEDPELSLVLLEAGLTLISGTSGLGLSIFGASALGKQTQVNADYAGTIKSCANGSKDAPSAYLTSNPTLVGGTPGWHLLDAVKMNGVANDAVGSGLKGISDGSLVARPNGGMVGVEVMGETGTAALFAPTFLVAMLKLPIS